MSDKEKQKLQDEIIKNLESDIKKIENTLEAMKEKLEYLKDIAWDRQSEMEREQMLKVLNGEKESTEVESNIGNILVDSELTEKLKKKHLDNPNLRGMITSDEFLSFPKVAKNVKPEFNPQYQGYTWQVKADDEKTLIYGEREYEISGKDTHRLLTNYSESERGQRNVNEAGVGERGHSHRQINDPDFLRPADEIITQNKPSSANSFPKENTKKEFSAEQIKAMQEKVKNASQNLGLGDSAKGKGVELGKSKDIDLDTKR